MNGKKSRNQSKQACLSGPLMTLEQKKSFQPKFVPRNCFWSFQLYEMLDIVQSCNLVQYQGKLMMQPWENGKNPTFRNFFSWVLPLLVMFQCSKLSSYAISRKRNEPNLIKWQRTLNLAHLAQIFFAGFTSTSN